MNTRSPLRLAVLLLALLLTFSAGLMRASSQGDGAAADSRPSAPAGDADVEAPGNPIDTLYAQYMLENRPDARAYRALWEHELRALYDSYSQLISRTPDGWETGRSLMRSLYTFLDWAHLRAPLDAVLLTPSTEDDALANLYRAEALRLHEMLALAGQSVGYEPVEAVPDSDTIDQWETQWAFWDRYNRYDLMAMPLAGAWPQQGLALWGLGEACASVLEVDGRQVVLPLDIPSIWRADPQALRADLDGDGVEEVAVTACHGWGTGVLMYGLCIVTHTPDMWPYFGSPVIFSNDDFAALAAPHLSLELEEGAVVAKAFGGTAAYSVADWDEPVTEIEPLLNQFAWVEMDGDGGIRLHVGIGFASPLNASPIYFAAIEGDLSWDGTALTLENGILSEW